MSNYSISREHILHKYPVPRDIKRGTVVNLKGKPQAGKITGFHGAHVIVRFLGDKRSCFVHPLELAYNGESWDAVIERRDKMNAAIDKFNQALNKR